MQRAKSILRILVPLVVVLTATLRMDGAGVCS